MFLHQIALIVALALSVSSANGGESLKVDENTDVRIGAGKGLCEQGPLATLPCLYPVKLGKEYLLLPGNISPDPIRYSIPPREVNEELFVVLWPGLEHRTKENIDEFLKVPGYGRRIFGYIQTLEKWKRVESNPLGFFLGASRYNRNFQTIAGGSIFNLHLELSKNKYNQNDIYYQLGEVSKGGLPPCTEHDIEIGVVEHCENMISTLIECTSEGVSTQNPSCQHRMVIRSLNALVKIQYHKKFLPDWKQIQDGVIAVFKKSRTTLKKIQKKSK